MRAALGDLAVAQTGGDEAEDLHLAGGDRHEAGVDLDRALDDEVPVLDQSEGGEKSAGDGAEDEDGGQRPASVSGRP